MRPCAASRAARACGGLRLAGESRKTLECCLTDIAPAWLRSVRVPTMRSNLVLAAGFSLLLVGAARAADVAEVPRADAMFAPVPVASDEWIVTVRGTVSIAPRFEGSDRFGLFAFPGLGFRRASQPVQFSAPDDGADFAVYRQNGFSIGPVARFRPGRYLNDDARLFGLHDVRWSVEPGVFVEYWATPEIRARAELRHGVRGREGFVADFGVDWVSRLGAFTAAVGPRQRQLLLPHRIVGLPGRLRLLPAGALDRVHDGVEGQQGRGVPGLEGAHRLEHGQVLPLARRRRTVLLEHAAHGGAHLAQLLRRRADDMAGHDRRRGLAERAGLHVVGEVRHRIPLDLEVDRHGRAAQLRVRRRARVGLGEAPEPRDVGGELEDFAVVDVVQHRGSRVSPLQRRALSAI